MVRGLSHLRERPVGQADRDDDLAYAPVDAGSAAAESERLGWPGRPLNQRTPFMIGLTGALGVAVAYVLFRTISDAGTVISLVGLSLFLALGLDPAVVWLTRRHLPRWLAVLAVLAVLVLFVAGFALAAALPISREVHQLSVDIPEWRRDIKTGHGWIGHLAQQLHLNNVLSSKSTKISGTAVAGGVLGAGKAIISAATALSVVTALTIYFLIALPSVRALWLRFMPHSRRPRVGAITDEVASRVGGFVLGNLLTSLIAGIGTTVWMVIFGLPYPILLGLLVALLDLIPVVGSTIGGIIVSLVALTAGLPVALATVGFYVAYRLLEDYLLTPRVMRHTVRISPGLTIIATLVGGVLLGLIGALVAIPTAAAIHLILEEVTFPAMERR